MRLVKIGKIPGMIDISEQKVRELVKSGEWKEGEHYYAHPKLNHKLFDMDAIEKWVKCESGIDDGVMALAEKLVS